MVGDLEYLPVLADVNDLVQSAQMSRILVVGGSISSAAGEAQQIRIVEHPEGQLPTGLYVFRHPAETWLMVVHDGTSPGLSYQSSWDATDTDPLRLAYRWFEAWWPEASVVPRPQFGVGAPVIRLSDEMEGLIRARHFDIGQWFYSVRLKGRTVDVREADLQTPVADDDPEGWIQRTPESAEKLAATITKAKLTEQLTDTVYSFRASRTVFRPYQFRPVLKLLESGRLRLLIADEVGLGKTIEAGLLWTELDARRQANRVLVVCPSGLVAKWKDEMDLRFGYDLEELTRPDLDELLDRFENDRFPKRFHGIVSVERLRIWGGLDRLAELPTRFDLIIVDEAHVFRNSGTRSNALGSLLSDWADALVFLSATPLNLGNDDLFNLLQLLSPGDFDDRQVLDRVLEPNRILSQIGASLLNSDIKPQQRVAILDSMKSLAFGSNTAKQPEFHELRLLLQQPLDSQSVVRARQLLRRLHTLDSVVTRTRKIEVQEQRTVREPISIDVQWTEAETSFYREYEEWQRRRSSRKGVPSGFAMQMPMRLASTCLPAARDRVLALARGVSPQPLDTEDEHPDDLTDSDVSQELESVIEESPPDALVEAAHALGETDTKLAVFIEKLIPLVRSGKRVLVFSFSRPTLAYLHEKLSQLLNVRVMHGGVSKEDRAELIADFRGSKFEVMLASRVASEGLDFEFCSAVVNYDLPWNPMEVEQRIGRIDRFGQPEQKIFILNFHTPGTIETDIIERVHERIGVFTSSIGELEPILRDNIGELRRAIFDYELTPEQRSKSLNATLAAIEEQKLAVEDLERSSGLLASADNAEIEGLERDLLATGRYIGQFELVLLLKSWVNRSRNADLVVSDDGKTLRIHGSRELEFDLRLVQSEGERSASELDRLGAKLRDGIDIYLSLDQEHARTTNLPLLTANHPLIRAAIASGVHGQARFAAIKIRTDQVAPGNYLCLMSVARWRGIHSSNELWTSVVHADTLEEFPTLGEVVLSSLADNSWQQGSYLRPVSLPALHKAMSQIRRQRIAKEKDRSAANSRLIDTRRLSIEETFRRKRSVIARRIETARRNQSPTAVRLGESQLAQQDRLHEEAQAELELKARYSMEVEHLAVCLVEVVV